jgi:hypothetical protein
MSSSIFVPAVTAWVEEGRAKVAEIREAEEVARKLEKKLTETREAAQMRRYEMGAFLVRVRDQMPRRGTKENGWKQFLEAIEVDDSTAHRYMELAKSAATSHEFDLRHNEPQVREGALPPDAPPPVDEDAPAEPALDRDEDGARVAAEPEIDRNTWCTPREWASASGRGTSIRAATSAVTSRPRATCAWTSATKTACSSRASSGPRRARSSTRRTHAARSSSGWRPTRTFGSAFC